MNGIFDEVPGMKRVDSSLNEENAKPEEQAPATPPAETKSEEQAPATPPAETKSEEQTPVTTSVETKTEEQVPIETQKEEKPFISEDDSILDIYERIDNSLVEQYGYTTEDIKVIQSMDPEQMDSVEILKAAMLLDDPEISDIEIEAALQEYKYLDEDKFSDEDIQNLIDEGKITPDFLDLLSAKFAREERNAIKKINEIKSKLPNLSEIKYMVKKAEQQNAPAKIEEQMIVLKNALSDNLKNYAKETFKITNAKGEVVAEVNFDVNDEAKSGVINTMTGNSNMIWQRWLTDKEGQVSVDYNKMRRDILTLDRFEDISRTIFNEGVSIGSKSTVEKIDNIDFKRGNNSVTEPTKPLTAEDKARNSILG